jgi:fatty-acyl-CoA synthase
MTLGDLLDSRAAAYGEKEALVFAGSGRVTYRELQTRANELADSLLALGVREGDRVGLLSPASVDLVACAFAVAKAGGIGVPVNARFKGHELSQIITHSGMAGLVTDGATLELLTTAVPSLIGSDGSQPLSLPEAPELRHVVLVDADDRPGCVGASQFGALTSPEGAVARIQGHLHQGRRNARTR